MMTVKQIADCARVSKTTVTKYLRAYEAEHEKEAAEHITKTEQNIIQISDELAETLLEAILDRKDNRKSTANHTANLKELLQTVCGNQTTNQPPTYANSTANQQTLPPTVSANPSQTANQDTIVALNTVIETLKAQNEQLNRTIDQYQQDKHDLKEQLAVKDNQIEQLNILLSQQQQLQQTLQVRLLETEADVAEETEKPKKRGLFGIFKKKENENG